MHTEENRVKQNQIKELYDGRSSCNHSFCESTKLVLNHLPGCLLLLLACLPARPACCSTKSSHLLPSILSFIKVQMVLLAPATHALFRRNMVGWTHTTCVQRVKPKPQTRLSNECSTMKLEVRLNKNNKLSSNTHQQQERRHHRRCSTSTISAS